MVDVKSICDIYTWNNKQQGNDRIFPKLDRIMANVELLEYYNVAKVCFMSEGEFDQSPSLLIVYPISDVRKKSFRYLTMWKYA